MIRLAPAFLRQPLAHRALHDITAGRPENSRAAISAALQGGYGIEIDVQASADGVAMVFHDADLGRLTAAKGPLRAQNAATLAAITLSGSDEGIPTLDEVLALIDGRAPLLVELKDQHGQLGVSDGVLEAAVARTLAGYEGPVALMSFSPYSVGRLAELAPMVARGLVTAAFAPADFPELPERVCTRLRAIPDYDAVRASFISHEWADLERARVAELKAGGATVLCWTVRSAEEEQQARQLADNITFEHYLPKQPA